jgi:hypothetical protein
MREKEPGVWRPMPVDARAQAALTTYLEAAAPLVPAAAMTPEHVEELRALGYVEPAPEPAPEPEPVAGAPGHEGAKPPKED